MGDRAVEQTIKVKPGDNITLDWWAGWCFFQVAETLIISRHHDSRIATDDIIADSHKGKTPAKCLFTI
jgi:hypothetical protein